MRRWQGHGLLALAAWLALAVAAAAQQIVEADYRQLMEQLDARADFEGLPLRREPGFNLDAPYRERGLWIGERFAGQQTLAEGPRERLSGAPAAPLRLRTGATRRNLSVAFHRGFGSNALFPLGPEGFPRLTARGEGAVALMFDSGQRAVGVRIHSGYPSPLGNRAGTGRVIFTFYDRRGKALGRIEAKLEEGINEFGFREAGNAPDIAGLTIENTDPGGIAIDDIIYSLSLLLG